MEGSILVFTWFGGISAGAALALGIVEFLTGRVLINPKHVNWSEGEAKVQGFLSAAVGLVGAVWVLLSGLALSSASSPNWVGPAWFQTMQFLIFPLGFVFMVAYLLVQLHHDGRWPFKRSGG